MGGINVDGGHGGKKSVDSEIPLIPFIDLLLCCVMFLLVTAVWNKLASVDANLGSADPHGPIDRAPDRQPLTVHIEANGYVVSSDAGDRIQIPLAHDGAHDVL